MQAMAPTKLTRVQKDWAEKKSNQNGSSASQRVECELMQATAAKSWMKWLKKMKRTYTRRSQT